MKAKDNPFASRYVEALAYRCPDRREGVALAGIVRRLSDLNYRAAITGPEGTGKTTLLQAIGNRLQQDGFSVFFFRFTKEAPGLYRDFIGKLPAAHMAGHVFLLDGIEQLSWPNWKRLQFHTRKAGGLIITSHTPGRLPALVAATTTPELLYDLVEELVGEREMLCRQEINQLFTSHQGNIRLALRQIYDLWAERD